MKILFVVNAVLLFTNVVLGTSSSNHYNGYVPQISCRDTHDSIYAEVCVPAFKDQIKPINQEIKEVIDNEYCYKQIRTACETTSKTQDREICTYNYKSQQANLTATTKEVTYKDSSETMRVTTCSPSGYGGVHGYGSEHQYCHEEYQTQSYRVPLVQEPLAVSVSLSAPQPIKSCIIKPIEVTEVVCRDIEEKRCFNVAKFRDSVKTIDQVETVVGEPKCDHLTLTLPTQACSQNSHGYAGAGYSN